MSNLWKQVPWLPKQHGPCFAPINGISYFINKAKYTTGDGSTNFRIPLLYAYGSLKLIDDSTRIAGSLQAGQVGQFTDNEQIPIGDSFTGPGPSTHVGRGAADPGTALFSTTFNSGLENYATNIGLYGLIRI